MNIYISIFIYKSLEKIIKPLIYFSIAKLFYSLCITIDNKFTCLYRITMIFSSISC